MNEYGKDSGTLQMPFRCEKLALAETVGDIDVLIPWSRPLVSNKFIRHKMMILCCHSKHTDQTSFLFNQIVR
jgi:hypothetical protein